ncbi:hypothetical protein HID58_009349 [Brassica napus]|uniref:Defensin-like domain-containing protein n=1 Tax=Brassica napus TaxID=3708 RepID=A0ABQ8DS84_BRANA|nr:hypothetical protein HID58_009349 [Brassica napus]
MGSSKLFVAFAIVITLSIYYDHLSGIGINAIVLPPDCFNDKPCNITFNNQACNKMCRGMSYKDGLCTDPELIPPYFWRCCCNPK